MAIMYIFAHSAQEGVVLWGIEYDEHHRTFEYAEVPANASFIDVIQLGACHWSVRPRLETVQVLKIGEPPPAYCIEVQVECPSVN